MVNEQDYIELGLSCADICGALERGMGEKELNDLNKSVCDAINQLTTYAEPVNPFRTLLLLWSRSQDCRRHTKENNQKRRAAPSLSIFPLEER